MRAGISVGTYTEDWEKPRCRSPPVCGKAAFFSLEIHTHVLYNGEYEMNKKAGLKGLQPYQPLCRRYQLLTQHKYYAPTPILLEIPLFINTRIW